MPFECGEKYGKFAATITYCWLIRISSAMGSGVNKILDRIAWDFYDRQYSFI